MKKLHYGFAASVIAGIGIIGIATSSHARSVPAFIGQPQAPGNYACFTNNNGTVTNICSTTKQFCMSLPIDDSLHTLSIVVFAPDINHNLSCFGQANFNDNTIAGLTGFQSPGAFGISQILTLPTLSVPGLGNLFACCNLAPTAKVESINY